MIKLLGKVPDTIYIACSGGSDSMAVLNFLSNSRRQIKVAHFDHGTMHADAARTFVVDYCEKNGIPYVLGTVGRKRLDTESREEYWRNERYRFFEELDAPIITAHHLDDVAEWWIFTSLHGESKLIPYQNGSVIRPFLMTHKQELMSWVKQRHVPFVTDPSNKNCAYMRNLIRHRIMSQCLKVNPGLKTVLRKKLVNTIE